MHGLPQPPSASASRRRRRRRRLDRRTLALLATPVLVAVAASLTVGQAPARAAVPAPPAGFKTMFSDDFEGPDGSGVDTVKWSYAIGTGYSGGADTWGTGEIETMTSSTANVSLDGNGHLAITPIRDTAGNWTSGRIETQRTDFAAPAGGVLRVEASIQQPNVTTANGAAYWPAFWMLGEAARPVGATNWPGIGEIDILEDVNGRSSVFSTLHCGTPEDGPCNEKSGLGSGEKQCPGCQTGYHTYTMEYDRSVSPEQLRWYLDGGADPYFTLLETAVDATTWSNALHHGFFLILNVAIGGGFPGDKALGGHALPNANTVSGIPMLVDYVSVAVKPGPRSAYDTLQAESFDSESGTLTQDTTDTGDGSNVGWIANGDWLAYRGVDFGSTPATQFRARVASGAGAAVSGMVEVRLDSPTSTPVGSFALGDTGGWQSWRTVPANLSAVTGVHDVYLTFTSGQPSDFVNVNWLTFAH